MFSRVPVWLALLLTAACMTRASAAAPREDAEIRRLTEQGFDHFYNLEYDEAIEIFRQAVRRAPKEARLRNHLAQSLLYRAMFRAGALESELVTGHNAFLRRKQVEPTPEEHQLFQANIEEALKLTAASLAGNAQDAGALFEQGITYALRANYNFLVKKAWLASLRDATRARRCHAEVLRLQPGNADARLIEGVHDYVVGSLPWHMKVLGFLAGFRGDKEEGIRTVQYVAQHGSRNRLDAEILLTVLYRREKRPAEGIPLLADLIRKFPRNFLLRFELAQMYSDLGNGEEALRVLDEVDRLRRAGAPGYERVAPERIAFARGNVQFWYNWLDDALASLRAAAAGSEKLDLNSGTLAWMRLGQTYDLKGRRQEAIQAYRKAIEHAPDSEIAAESRRYLREPYRRVKNASG